MKHEYDLVVIGAGPAGMAAALAAEKKGVEKILILERDQFLGGILPQCIHNGFGLEYFKEELTGPEYAIRFIDMLKKSNIVVKKETMVLQISTDKTVTAINKEDGLIVINAKAIVLAMGCRERTREAILIPGERPAGIFTAGTAQRYVNIEGYIPGKEVVILGSGDIGMIMARRMTLEGANVKAVLEILPYSSGLIRNKVQCLDDFGIPLKYDHTIISIKGKKRVEGVTITRVDENLRPVPGTEEDLKCDTVLLSVGLIPENELSKDLGIRLDPVTGGPCVNEARETTMEGVFACGNVLQVHDLVDYVTEEGEIAGRSAAIYLDKKSIRRKKVITLTPGSGIQYIVPQSIVYKAVNRKYIKLFMRVKKPSENIKIVLTGDDGRELLCYKKDFVTPGEMICLNLPETLLNSKLNNISFSLNKKESEVIV